MCYEERIACRLVANYNKDSSKGTYGISTGTIYPEYYSGEKNGVPCLDTESFAQFNRIIEKGISRGLFSSNQDKRTFVYKRITATAKQVQDLADLHSLTLLPEYVERMRLTLSLYKDSDCQRVQDWVSQQLGEKDLADVKNWFKFDMFGDISQQEKELKELLDTCDAISGLKDDVLMRNFSVGRSMGSKGFEQSMKNRVCTIMAPEQYADGVNPNEILKSLHILQNPASVWIKGNGHIVFRNGDTITCSAYTSPLALTRDWVECIDHIDAKSLLTIENLTTFNDYHIRAGEFVVFTSGFANSLVVEFIRKCAADNALTSVKHFGDIDAFGFVILRDLVSRTGIEISPYYMDALTYEANKAQAINMTDGNRTLFQKLIGDPFYSAEDKGLFRLLLEEGKTLEQEGIFKDVALTMT